MFFPCSSLTSDWQEQCCSSALSCCHGPHICSSCFGSWASGGFQIWNFLIITAWSHPGKGTKWVFLDCSQKNFLPLFICWYLTYITFVSKEGMRCQDRLWQIWHQDCLYNFELGHCNTSSRGPFIKFSTGPLLHSVNEWLLFLFVISIWCGPMPYLGCVVQSMQWIKNCLFPNGHF